MAEPKFVSVPLPAKMNTDHSPTMLDPDEGVDIYNYMIHEPGQLRARKGYKFKAAFPGTSFATATLGGVATAGFAPVGIAVTNAAATTTSTSLVPLAGNPTRAIVTFMDAASVAGINSMYHRQVPGPLLSSATQLPTTVGTAMYFSFKNYLTTVGSDAARNAGNGAFNFCTYLINADTDPAWNVTCVNMNGSFSGYETESQATHYFNQTFYTSADVVTALIPNWAPGTGGTQCYLGTRLFKYAGVTPNTTYAPITLPMTYNGFTLVVNNGASTGTIYANIATITAGVNSATQTLTMTNGWVIGNVPAGSVDTAYIYDSTLTTLRGSVPIVSVNTGASQITLSGPVNTSTGDVVLMGPPLSLQGYYMANTWDELTTGMYSYLITSHSQYGTSVTLNAPYGIGQPTSVIPNRTLSSNKPWYISPVMLVFNAPPDIEGVYVYQNQLFVGRASLVAPLTLPNGTVLPVGAYPNAIGSSQVGNTEVWPASNWALVDDKADDAIMGFCSVGNQLAIFRRHSIYLMAGTDWTNYQFTLFTDELGCIDGRSIVEYRNGAIFMSDKGVYYFDGSQLRDLTQSKPGHGVRSIYRYGNATSQNGTNALSYFLSNSVHSSTTIPGTDYFLISGLGGTVQWPSTGVSAYDGDNLLMYLPGPNAQTISYYYVPNGSWCRFGNSDATNGYANSLILFTKPGQHLNGKAVAFSRFAAYELDYTFEQEYNQSDYLQIVSTNGNTALESMLTSNNFTTTPAVGASWTFNDYRPPLGYDYMISYNGSTVLRNIIRIPLNLQFRDMMLGDGITTRVHNMLVEHNLFYQNGTGTSQAGAMQGYNINVGTDPEVDNLTTLSQVYGNSATGNSLQPSFEGQYANNQTTGFPMSIYARNYTAELRDNNWPLEGKVMRLKMDNSLQNGASYSATSYKLFALHLNVEKTLDRRIANPVL